MPDDDADMQLTIRLIRFKSSKLISGNGQWANKTMLIVLGIFCMKFYSTYSLTFPPTAVVQLVGSISIPVTNLSPERRINFDWGFQMNYNLPFDVAAFYNAPIWPTIDNSTVRMIRDISISNGNAGVHSRDFSLIEIYKAIEMMLESVGFHSSCLPLGICDLMRLPFDAERRQQDFFEDVLSLLLRPTRHLVSISKQLTSLEGYLKAEIRGYMGLDCKRIYTKCSENILDLFSIVDFGSFL